ncbi:MAG: serpin family protein [Bacillota bacterium]|nr:serpin family protein [Bacillota bacterium]
MKRTYRITAAIMLFLLVVGLPVSGCRVANIGGGGIITMPKPNKEVLDAFEPSLSGGANQLGIHLFARLLEEEKEIFLSPTSIALALAMTYNGARGETKEAMAEVLGVTGLDLDRVNENNQALIYLLQSFDPSVKLHIANSLWMREGMQFDPAFIGRSEAYYNALINELDFNSPEAAKIINKWVSERTEGLIEEIIEPPIDPLTILFLINAIYFQGDWSKPFDEEYTRDDAFYITAGEAKTVPFMFRSGEFDYYEEEDFQAVRIPYGKKESMAMFVFLPDESSGLTQFINTFAEKSWDDWRKEFHQAKGDLYLPRFSMEYEKTLNEVLQDLGMGIAFDKGRADFFDMVSWEGEPRLFISEVKHKAFIEVNEKGTKAAAVTSVEMSVTSAPAFWFNMKADRPFVFLIHDSETDTILFMGAVTDPK